MKFTDKTVSDACQAWLKTARRNELEASTLKAYRSHVHIHIEPRIRDLLLSDLSRSDIRGFMDELLDDGISRALTRKVMVSLRSILSEAVEREWMQANVGLEVKMKRSKRGAQERIIPTKDEIRTLIDTAPESHRALIVTAIFTGMRISELRGLTWNHVDLGRGLILVRQRADDHGKLGSPKSRAGVRDIPMAPMVKNTLTAWKETVRESDMDLVFPNAVGKVQSYSNFYNRIFKPMLVENGIVDGAGEPKFAVHSLRHAAASLFIEQGWNPKKIQTLLGHATINMTMDTYGHLFESPEEDLTMFAKLESDLLAA